MDDMCHDRHDKSSRGILPQKLLRVANLHYHVFLYNIYVVESSSIADIFPWAIHKKSDDKISHKMCSQPDLNMNIQKMYQIERLTFSSKFKMKFLLQKTQSVCGDGGSWVCL